MREGWLRFWHTFTLPWPVVIGFAAATWVALALFGVATEVVHWVVR